jgi:hypothetical protein
MATTYTLISSVTVGSGGSATIDFTSIPQTYTDLEVRISARSSLAGDGDYLLVNYNNSTSNISSKSFGGYGASTVFTGTEASYFINIVPAANVVANTFSNTKIYVPNYTSSNFKPASMDGVYPNNSSNWWIFTTAGLWSNTAAITSLKLDLLDGNFIQNSTAYLYGISNA